ncbi:MAG: dipeptide epimerase [Henriciella sp.]|nr:dipeptide epimerase [Henriciella sp.]
MPTMTITPVSSPLRTAFAISRGAKTSAETIRVDIRDGEHTGRGECVPYTRYGESRASVVAQLEEIKADINAGMNRLDVQHQLPGGAARCAVDCALWDLEAKQSGKPVWQLAGLPKPAPLACTMSLSLDTPEAMAQAATETSAKLLKLKLGGPEDMARIEAVHLARPDAELILDGNEGLDPDSFPELMKKAGENGAILIEQPFPVDRDEALMRLSGTVAICADESVHTSEQIQALSQKYDAVNIKLDKSGGLTEALKMVQEARTCGLGIMIGCMVAGSLSMAPALLLGGLADIIDLDGPLWIAEDVDHGLEYQNGTVLPASPELWG